MSPFLRGSIRAELADEYATEALRDSNAESQHHLLVARLHEEVYSKRFDLDAVLTKIAKDERAAEQDWGGSQATASEAGTPKKVRLHFPLQRLV